MATGCSQSHVERAWSLRRTCRELLIHESSQCDPQSLASKPIRFGSHLLRGAKAHLSYERTGRSEEKGAGIGTV